jgi:hypothetical protein
MRHPDSSWIPGVSSPWMENRKEKVDRKMTTKRALIAFLLAVVNAVVASPARADNIETVTMTFQSGATFSGTVDLSNDFSTVTGVAGTLYGYQFGAFGYVGSGSDTISWVYDQGTNFATGTNLFGTFLMDGTPGPGTPNFLGAVFTNLITFDYNYGSAPNLTFAQIDACTTGPTLGNCVNFVDPMVTGTISPVPEPGTVSLLLLGIGLVFVMRKRTGQGLQQAS